METCGRCGGVGQQTWDEDGRRVSDVCYHCGGTGQVDEESARALRLEAVAYKLAVQTVQAMRKAC